MPPSQWLGSRHMRSSRPLPGCPGWFTRVLCLSHVPCDTWSPTGSGTQHAVPHRQLRETTARCAAVVTALRTSNTRAPRVLASCQPERPCRPGTCLCTPMRQRTRNHACVHALPSCSRLHAARRAPNNKRGWRAGGRAARSCVPGSPCVWPARPSCLGPPPPRPATVTAPASQGTPQPAARSSREPLPVRSQQ